MPCGTATSKTDHGHDVEGSPLKCGVLLHYTEYPGGKVTRTETILCHACYKAAKAVIDETLALEEATRPS
jgi:hypothetical protein